MKKLFLSLLLLITCTAASANSGVLLARVTSTAGETVRTCEVRANVTKIFTNHSGAQTKKTKYTNNVPELNVFYARVQDSWGHFRRKMIDSKQNVKIVAYDAEGEEKMLYFITGSGRHSVLSHELSADGNTVFSFILKNCPNYKLPWISLNEPSAENIF